jgi:hypothetical protein
MHFVGHVDQLRHNHFLVLLVVDANQGGVVAQIEKGGVLRFHGLMKSVRGEIEAQTGVEIAVDAARFLDEVDAATDAAFSARK